VLRQIETPRLKSVICETIFHLSYSQTWIDPIVSRYITLIKRYFCFDQVKSRLCAGHSSTLIYNLMFAIIATLKHWISVSRKMYITKKKFAKALGRIPYSWSKFQEVHKKCYFSLNCSLFDFIIFFSKTLNLF
jgi:hypothetical protein